MSFEFYPSFIRGRFEQPPPRGKIAYSRKMIPVGDDFHPHKVLKDSRTQQLSGLMDRNFKYILLVVAWSLSTVFGCLFRPGLAAADPAPSIKVETSRGKIPKWVNQVPRADEEYFYFVGRATGATTLEDAEQDAAADALRQIVTMIGLTASFSYDRLRREAELLLEDRVSFAGDARVVGLKRLETYYEKVYYHTGDSLITRYNASLLSRYPRQALAREKARVEQEAIQRVKMAGELLAKADRYESENDQAEALDSYLQALQELDSPVIFLLPHGLGDDQSGAGESDRRPQLAGCPDERGSGGSHAEPRVSACRSGGRFGLRGFLTGIRPVQRGACQQSRRWFLSQPLVGGDQPA